MAAGTAAQASFSAVLIGLPVLAPELREQYGLSLSEVGIALSSVWVGPILTLLPWGLLADRIGERAVLASGLTVSGILVAAAGWAQSFGMLALLLVLAGGMEQASTPPAGEQ